MVLSRERTLGRGLVALALDESEQRPITRRRRKQCCFSEHARVADSAKLSLAPDDGERLSGSPLRGRITVECRRAGDRCDHDRIAWPAPGTTLATDGVQSGVQI